ncbi:MAG: sugar nucleotide-binding protein [Betaproteobacteria bacterium]|nr:sugar nucleotide-binding protein [Betaproteobacteria bacterium]
MRILIIGSNGFIARHIRNALVAEGHRVTGAARKPRAGDIACDLVRDVSPAVWRSRVQAFDAVINCVGLLAGSRGALQAVHADAPAAIATACGETRKPFLHIGILNLEGAPHSPKAPYSETKRAGEEAIRHAYPGATIVRPSVVFGQDSPATRMAMMQANLPLMILPQQTGLIVPIHVDDLAALCATLISTVRAQGVDVDAVGTAAMTMEEYLQSLRKGLGRPPAKILKLPNAWLRASLKLTGAFHIPNLHPALLDLMEHRHTGHPQHFLRWMRRDPMPVSEFLAPHPAAPIAKHPAATPHPV